MKRPHLLLAVIVFIGLKNSYLSGQIPSILFRDGRIISIDGRAANLQLASWEINGSSVGSSDTSILRHEVIVVDSAQESLRLRIRFFNKSKDILRLSNVVPFGADSSRVHLTGKGEHRLSRSHLFIPGRMPVNVILPDNAWELGFSVWETHEGSRYFGLARRDVPSIRNGTRKRFETILNPGGAVDYQFYIDRYDGPWQAALTKCFRDKKLYDLESFDEAMFRRPDLAWIRKSYVMHLLMAWDKEYYDAKTGKFNLSRFVRRGRALYGGDEVICLWPTWPSLGLDGRNQFDLYRDLPGGLTMLRKLTDTLRAEGTRFFIAYNPWDEGTRKEQHLEGLKQLLRQTGADGVVLDTRGSSSRELQEAADQVRPGIVMYSEGMAIPRDMPGIVSGRVHNALYYPPLLNLNKLIKPDFAIFRVAEVFKEPILREYATAFFNGYGTEINQFAPGHPDWEEDQYLFLGRTSRILRENTSIFSESGFSILLPTRKDSIWVNSFSGNGKTIHTLYSIRPEGYKGLLFGVADRKDHHYIDLWNHDEVVPEQDANGRRMMPVDIAGFSAKYLGTNNEGAVGCIVSLPIRMAASWSNGLIKATCPGAAEIRVWAGLPDYRKTPWISQGETAELHPTDVFGAFEGKFIVQAFDSEGELLDERVFINAPGTPIFLASSSKATAVAQVPRGMVRIPAGNFRLITTRGDEFIRYPEDPKESVSIPSFAMDRFPVTNREYFEFMQSTRYQPSDTVHFLRHWNSGRPRKGEEEMPVVHVSIEDARAYAAWKGRRLPTEAEWQYAAQAGDGREWPWKQSKPVKREVQYVNETLSVTRLVGIDPGRCNTGDGKPYPVGRYPKGKNPYGLEDLVGSVWQLTDDTWESGSYRYVIMKGGSHFNPSASWWYVQGGPRELHYRQYLLRVSQGFERNSTVGFRTVADLKE